MAGGHYRFDAVSGDGRVVVNILSNRARTANENENTGGIRKALNDLRFLGLARKADRRIMVFTDVQFCDLVQKRGVRMGIDSVEFIVCELPEEFRGRLDAVLDAASAEQLRR